MEPTIETRKKAAALLKRQREKYNTSAIEMSLILGWSVNDIIAIETIDTDVPAQKIMCIMRTIGGEPSVNVDITVSVPRGKVGRIKDLARFLNTKKK